MRPHRLVIEGLRSYRTNTVIDFTDASLFAIVGDTGSGKSSILEAIVYALYASTTWGRQAGDLISDGMRSMTVEMTFEVDGREWLLRRSMSRGGYPPPVHLLEAVDDRTLRFDTSGDVNAHIERLLGLSWEAFCSAVILPQGHFERLLTATPANRTGILKGIFRLERLEEVRAAARAIADAGEPRWHALREHRASLLEDPAGAAAAARVRVDEAEAELEVLSGLSSALADLRHGAEEATRRGVIVGSESRALATARGAVDAAEGARLAALNSAIEGELAPRRAARVQAIAAESAAIEAVAKAKAVGADEASFTRYRDALEFARRKVPEVAQRRADQGTELEALAAAEQAWTVEQASLADFAAAITAAALLATAALGEADRARRAHDEVAALLTRARGLAARAVAARVAATEAAAEAVAMADRKGEAVEAQTAAETAVAEAEAELAVTRAHDSAVTAAHGLHPGDDCPVCARRLPPSWRAPDAGNLEAAVRSRDQASAHLVLARRATAEVERDSSTAAERVRGAEEAARGLEADLETETAAIAGHLPGWSPAVDNADAIVPLAEQLRSASGSATAAAQAETNARGIEAAAKAHLAERRNSLDHRAGVAARANELLESDISQLRETLAVLPPELAVPEGASVEEFEASFGRLGILEDEAASRAAALTAARTERLGLDSEIGELERRLALEVVEPLAAHRESVTRLSSAVERSEHVLGLEPIRSNDERSVVARSEELDTLLAAEVSRCSETIAEAAVAGATMLSDHGFGDEGALADRLRSVTGARAVAEAEHRTAESQIARAAALDERIREGGNLLSALRELVRLLGDGSFIAYVVQERQRALLGIASVIFGDMSGARYGFAEDFEIVDRTSGQPRSAKTLSGGETFQASLSLALGLVELAGRSGGRLSSLFLDEGFGTLDANALDEALEELERRAASGRIIGVISHLRVVADRLEHVLRVEKEKGRTTVRWIGPTDIQEMAEADLAHVAGLTG